MAGTTTSRSCSASGNPRPVLAWLKDGVEITGNEGFLMSEVSLLDEYNVASSLHIGSESRSDGVYQCLANGFTPDGSISLVYSNSSEIIFTCKKTPSYWLIEYSFSHSL